MEDIKEIVTNIIRGCSRGGVDVSPVLAAFIARTIVEEDNSSFALDKAISSEMKEEVILRSIERLLEKDNPSLEMIKMQVDFDSSFLEEESEAQQRLRARSKLIATHKQAISEVKMNDAQDYDALSVLYRKIFRFFLEFAPHSVNADKPVEREVAAALESVFPRVGLKTFIQLNYEDKMNQLLELARIILGIRILNKEEGRGAGGIDNMDRDSVLLSNVLLQDIERDIEFFTEACTKYQKIIIKSNVYYRRKKFIEKKNNESSNVVQYNNTEDVNKKPLSYTETYSIKQLDDINEDIINRWSQELSNRRQYLNFLMILLDDVKFLNEKIINLTSKITSELNIIKGLVSNKASVSKEIIYPKFEILGTTWLQLYEEVILLIARSNTFQVLNQYRLSFTPTLVDNLLGDFVFNEDDLKEIYDENDEESLKKDDKNKKNDDDLINKTGSLSLSDEKDDNKKLTDIDDYKNNDDETERAELLTIENTPDFTQLPLELQGFCPWTIVEAYGLLLPGKPSLGIVRYKNQYFVCDNEFAIKSFLRSPKYYLDKIFSFSLYHPEFIHLLRLHKWFPTANINKLLEKSKNNSLDTGSTSGTSSSTKLNFNGQPLTKDASTETPTHFIESNIDLQYHWNLWELRRRQLRVLNLTNCTTTSQQTDDSHFRRENETQVYLPRDNETQTRRDRGTNPPTVTTYFSGLRGKVYIDSDAKQDYNNKSENKDDKDRDSDQKDTESQQSDEKSSTSPRSSDSKYDEKLDKEPSYKKIGYPKCGIVTLTLDL